MEPPGLSSGTAFADRFIVVSGKSLAMRAMSIEPPKRMLEAVKYVIVAASP